MIFKNLFKRKKWLSEKVSDRLAAIAELELSDLSNKPIIHELAFNDNNDKVRRAALDKLSDFALWWQAFKHDVSEPIKKHAEKVIVDSLTGKGTVKIDASLKSKFITECNISHILEKVVFSLDDESLVLSVLNKLDKESLYFKAITDSALSAELKKQLIENTNELGQLRKLSKKLTAAQLELVNAKIQVLTEEAERPVKIEKHVRLLLARLNALKEKSDFDVIQSQMTSLNAEWLANERDISLLSESVQTELATKYNAINVSLERILAPLKAQFEKEQAIRQTAIEQDKNYTALNTQLDSVEGQITSSIVEEKEIDQVQITETINSISKQCHELALTEQNKAQLIKRCESIFNRANQVPQIKQAIINAAQVITELSQLEAPKDLASLNVFNPQFKAIKLRWQENVSQANIALPENIANEYKIKLTALQEPVWQLEREQKQMFNQTRRKMAELEGLVKEGRYHNAFGLFKKLTFWFAELNDYQQAQLTNKWQILQEQVDGLRELERSFSNPKKQELLEEIGTLATTPIADPTEQAHRVRLLRSNWQSLGHAGDDTETELNKQFDDLCEQAFVPCREHYQMLEKERSDSLAAKQLILEQLQKLNDNLTSSQVADWRELESVFVKLTKLWRETGLVDREKVDEVNGKYRTLCSPIRKAINDHHSDNEQEKRDILKKAEAIIQSDDKLDSKIDNLKGLQNKWQKVGFAGKNVDQKLWREFRALNNPIFAQREEAYRQQKEQSLAIYDDFADRLKDLAERANNGSDISELRSVIDDVEAVLSSLEGLSKGQYEKLKRTGQEINAVCDVQIGKQRELQEKQVYVDLFAAVKSLALGEKAEVNHLKAAWQTALNTNGKSDRHLVTIKLELIAGISSPAADKAKRNEIQMILMSEKLEQGIEYSTQDLLEEWLTAGVFEETDLVLLDRIKPIFMN
ncbi:DUF349 domain-containing protein [Psychrosphaera sp. 1_MG-2023]|uniref:DUF349 domain-containing protein n=1 Tax=Psychrosphaera sp. 1_MG-2023 TaxID=3062643 RepID=UPI0026E2A85D|nr:DUF349 domain-containing protein [Psychrosphaera sp. 1_MG-2023]MDO6717897.1 DUF349 domain-containing protein [Psychrosphaera sp. 1_MG-2023]